MKEENNSVLLSLDFGLGIPECGKAHPDPDIPESETSTTVVDNQGRWKKN